MEVKTCVLRHINYIRIGFVSRPPFGLDFHQAAIERDHLSVSMAHWFYMHVAAEFLPKIMTGKDQRTPSVFLFAKSIQVRSVAYLRFDLFFAVSEIVVGNDCNYDPGIIPAGKFEGLTVIV